MECACLMEAFSKRDHAAVSPEGCEVESSEKAPKPPAKLMHNCRLLGCFFGPILLVISLNIFKDNIRIANKLGLQRMRTQRTVKRAQIVHTNCSLDGYLLDPYRSLRVIRKKHRKLKRASHSKNLNHHLNSITDELDIFSEDLDTYHHAHDSIFACDEWNFLNEQADKIVQKYTGSIETFDVEQSVLFWFVVTFNTTCWILLAYLVHKHEGTYTKYQLAKTRIIEEEATATYLRSEMKQRRFMNEIMNHRFGNRIRQARLLFEAQQYEDLEVILRTWEYETDIRMGILTNLPTCGISAQDLFAQVFTFHHTITCFCENTILLRFFDAKDQVVSYPILQVAFLQDMASNVLKHGGAYARVEIYQDRIVIRNKIIQSGERRASNRIGLSALLEQSRALNIPFEYSHGPTEFCNILRLRSEAVQINVDPIDTQESSSDFDYSKYSWLLVEDSQTIAEMTARQYKKLGIDLVPYFNASDVFALEAIVVETSRRNGKPIIIIFDENIFTLDHNLDIVPETGTNVRHRLLRHSICAAMHESKRLLFASCSASEIENDSCLICKLGKSTPPSRQLIRLREKLKGIQ